MLEDFDINDEADAVVAAADYLAKYHNPQDATMALRNRALEVYCQKIAEASSRAYQSGVWDGDQVHPVLAAISVGVATIWATMRDHPETVKDFFFILSDEGRTDAGASVADSSAVQMERISRAFAKVYKAIKEQAGP